MHSFIRCSKWFLMACSLFGCAGTPTTQTSVPKQVQDKKIVSTADDNLTSQTSDSTLNTASHADSTNANACFEHVKNVWDKPFIASSLMLLKSNKNAIVLNSPDDDAIILAFDAENNALNSSIIAEKSQISCLNVSDDGIQIGLIERNAMEGAFSTVVRGFTKDFEPKTSLDWRVNTRGFIPDPGTRCAFAGNRSLFVIGTRPRNEHVPYHGLFKAQPRSLDFFESTQEHTPVLLDIANRSSGESEILLRETRRDENDKPVWPHVVVAVNDNNELVEKTSADFILQMHSEWIKISKNGCVEWPDGSQKCAENLDSLTDVQILENASERLCMVWTSWSHSWIACDDKEKIQTVQIPDEQRLFSFLSEQGTVFWGMYKIDKSHPDIAEKFQILEADLKCLGLE